MLLACGLITLSSAPRPNIVFILSDDLGFGDYSISDGVNRTHAIPTPHIQSLADGGVKFQRGYSGPVCAPSRCTLITGRHMGHCRIRGNDGSYRPLQDGDATVASVLKQAGYVTGIAGKWGLGDGDAVTGYNTTGYPLARGFDWFVGQSSQVGCHNWYPNLIQNNSDIAAILTRNQKIDNKNCLGTADPTCYWANDMAAETGVSFIRAHANGAAPFFLYLATTTPHVGNLAGEKNDWPTPFAYMSTFDAGGEFGDWPLEQRQFASATWAQDAIVGDVLKELDEQGIRDSTLVMFSGVRVRASVAATIVMRSWHPTNLAFSLLTSTTPSLAMTRTMAPTRTPSSFSTTQARIAARSAHCTRAACARLLRHTGRAPSPPTQRAHTSSPSGTSCLRWPSSPG